MSSNIFVRYDLERRLLACGYHDDLPVKLGQVTWMDKPAYTSLILDVPPEIGPGQAAKIFLRAKIDPPRFWIPFSDLGPGQKVTGEALTLTEAASRAGMTRAGMTTAAFRGHLPYYKNPAPQPGGKRGLLVNSLDLERFMATPRPKGRTPTKTKPPARPRGRPKGSKDTRPRKLWHKKEPG